MNISWKGLDGRVAGNRPGARPHFGVEPVDTQPDRTDDYGHKLVEAFAVGVVAVDPACVLTYGNPRFASQLGYTREELIGRPFGSLVCPSHHDAFIVWQDEIRNGLANPIEVALFQKSGSCTWVQLSVAPPLHNGAEPGGVYIVVADIADRISCETELRRSKDELRILSAKLVNVQERERQRIATDLHDGLGQSLTTIKFGVEQALSSLRSDANGASIMMLETLLARLKDTVGEVRRVAMDAWPATLDDLGLVASLSWLFREFETVYFGIAVQRQVEIREVDMASDQKVVIYRIVQEALNNAAKHSEATTIKVSLCRIDDQFELVIRDNGRGFNQEDDGVRSNGRQGLGLASIRARAVFAGGTHALRSAIGQGVEIRVTLPLAKSTGKSDISCRDGLERLRGGLGFQQSLDGR